MSVAIFVNARASKMIAKVDSLPSDQTLIHNIKRIMAHEKLGYEDLAEATGLDARTLRSVLFTGQRPHARTLHKLASGLGVTVDELLKPAAHIRRRFDRATNEAVGEIVAAHPELVAGWSDAEYDELYSQFGVGGPLTEDGVLSAGRTINTVRELKHMVAVIMQSHEAELLTMIVRELYRRVTPGRSASA